MIEFTWIQSIGAILVFVISYILVFGAFKRLGIIGSDLTIAILSFLVSMLFISVTASVELAMDIISFATLIFVIGFFLILTVAFVAKDPFTFTKPLAWIFFITMILIAILLAFDHFPAFFHMMPGTSNSHLTSSAREIKNFIYSENFAGNFIFALSALIIGFILVKK